jgi:hypothetical protein
LIAAQEKINLSPYSSGENKSVPLFFHGGASGAGWKWRIGDNPAEWPTRHDYQQKKEETLNLKTCPHPS